MKNTPTYTFLWANTHQLFYMLGNLSSYIKHPHIPFNSHLSNVFQISHGNKMHCYIREDTLDNHVEEGSILLDSAFVQDYLGQAKRQCNIHLSFFKELSQQDPAQLSNKQLLNYWKGLIDHYAHSVAYFRSTQEEPSRKIIQELSQLISSTDDLQTLLVSPELDEINKEEVAWDILMHEGFTEEKALHHVHIFPWLFQNSLAYKETVAELQQRAQDHVFRDVVQEKRDLKEKQKDILTQYPQVISLVQSLQALALLRPLVKACWGSTGFHALPLLQEIARRYDIDLKTLVFLYRSEDVEALITEGKVLTKQDIEERSTCTAYILENGELRSFVGDEALAFEERLLQKNNNTATTLKGVPARPGIVTGKVHILEINEPTATKKFRESFTGGILVTSMTQPNVVDIARRADAIITDEGGMLCHAAIISREFGIPCIVGTHKATEVLKDGDKVEVNADTGIITILK